MLWIINAISVVQLVLLTDVVKRQSHMQHRLNYMDHYHGKNLNYLARLIEATR